MEISIRTVSHNSGNGGCFSLAAKIINADIPSFGSAINYFEIRPHFDDTHNLTPGGEGSFAAYRQSLKDLPSFTFSRVNRNLTMKYKSKVCKGIDLRRSAAERDANSLIENKSAILLKAFYAELIVALGELKKQIKPSDDFDLPAFLEWVSSKQNCRPETNEEVYKLSHQPNPTVDNDDPEPDTSYIKAMSAEEFWNVIDLVDTRALDREYQKQAMEPVVGYLELQPVDKIKSFHNHLSEFIYAIDTRKHCEGTRDEHTDDSWLYLRLYVVAQGLKYYRKVLADPSAMPKNTSLVSRLCL